MVRSAITFILFAVSPPLLGILRAEQSEMIEVANSELAARFSEASRPDFRWVVLHLRDSEDVAVVDRRALEMRSAKCFIYESASESSLQAMYRERLEQHGVTAIYVAPVTRRKTTTQPPNLRAPFLTLLSLLPTAP